jgi:ferredoxin-NADP reductase
VLLTLPIREVLPATARARIVRVDLQGRAFPYQAGQALLVASHGFDRRKPYSIASSPDETAREGWLELLVGLNAAGEPGPHLQLTPGSLVDIEGPVGRFTLPEQPEERRLLFVAGGTGIAPLRAMVRQSLARGDATVGVLYSARTPDDFAYESELRQLAAQGRIELLMTVTRDSGPAWNGTRGRIDAGLLAPLLHDRATLCFVCGPHALVADMPGMLADLGVARERIRIEEW